MTKGQSATSAAPFCAAWGNSHRAATAQRAAEAADIAVVTVPFKNYVVKAFNHIPSDDIATDGTLAGDPDRRALAIARTGAELIENIAKATR